MQKQLNEEEKSCIAGHKRTYVHNLGSFFTAPPQESPRISQLFNPNGSFNILNSQFLAKHINIHIRVSQPNYTQIELEIFEINTSCKELKITYLNFKLKDPI